MAAAVPPSPEVETDTCGNRPDETSSDTEVETNLARQAFLTFHSVFDANGVRLQTGFTVTPRLTPFNQIPWAGVIRADLDLPEACRRSSSKEVVDFAQSCAGSDSRWSSPSKITRTVLYTDAHCSSSKRSPRKPEVSTRR